MEQSALISENPPDYTAHYKMSEDHIEYSKNERSKLLKRIPLDRLMDLKVDYAFKQLFGNERNKEITVIFLNAILQRTGRNRIKDISFTNTESGGEYADDKESRLDLLVITEAEEWINVEIQFTNQYNMIKRSIYYWAGAYRSPLRKSMTYKELRPVIAINIMNFNLFNETERFHTTYHLYEDEDKFKLTNIMEFHFIEMSKLIKDWKDDKLDPWNDVLARWLLMLGVVDRKNGKFYNDIFKELEEIAMKDESLRSAFQNWEELSMTQEQYLAYESRLKRVMDEEAAQREMELRKQEVERTKQEVERTKQEVERTKQEVERIKLEVEQKEQEVKRTKQKVERKEQEVEQKERELEQRRKMAEQRAQEIEKKIEEAEGKVKQSELKAKQTEINAKETVARRLLARGMDIDDVVELSELTKERVTEIQLNIRK